MDDILSAALGQSGLNLSFLEEQQADGSISNSGSGASNNAQTVRVNNPFFEEQVHQSVKEDVEDVTELLNLLDDGPIDVTSSSNGGKNLNDVGGSGGNVDMLDFLLKYQSDEDDTESISSPIPSPIPSNIVTTMIAPQIKVKTIQIQSDVLDNRKQINISSKFPRISTNSPVLALNKTSTAASTKIVIPSTMFNNKLFVSKSMTSSQNVQVARSSVLTSPALSENKSNNTKLDQSTKPSKNLSDDERRKLSIQHVLASPNLTYREKQFLMKSALSANIKPSHPALSSTVKQLTGLKRSPSPNIVSANNEEEDDEDDNEMVHTDTYAEYMPMKVKVGYVHPDPVVETSSMASVAPPDVWYSLLLPRDIIDERKLSALQLESIVYASQQHEKLFPNGKRAGFLIGDGAGVGKGRTVAGVIFENYLRGRKRSIWLSVSNDLRYDAMRDLRDIGCHAKVMALNKFKYDEKITAKMNGKFKKGCIFATYSALIGETSGKSRFKSRLEQLLHWCGKDFDGVIILDECHKAKNLMPVGSSKPTKTGVTVLKLQDELPKARVVYCSATGASEPKNMAYMNRLGLWGAGTAFKEFNDFLQSVEKRGVGAMEMVAMDMKLRGMYIARQLSFTGVTFDVKEVKLCSSFIEMYDAAVNLWLDARDKFERAAEMVGLDGKGKKTMWGQFWSAHQRFFKYLCIAAKVKSAVDTAKQAVAAGKCVIFGLQSTGEARTLDQLDDLGGELNDFISTTKGVFSTLVEKHFPVSQGSCNGVDTNELLMAEKKRKREWRKTNNRKAKRQRHADGVEFMSSDDSSGSEDENSDVPPEQQQQQQQSDGEENNTFSDNKTSDGESGSEDERNDDYNPFANSSSDTDDDEDSWMRDTNETKKKKPAEKIAKLKITRVSEPLDPSASALAAAGLKLGRQYSWANVSTAAKPVFTDHMKSNRQTKISAPQGLSQRLSSLSNLKRSMSTMTALEKCRRMKENLLDQLEVLSPYLPPNTLDELIDELGGPENVAEMTGRKGRIVAKPDGSYVYEPRTKDDVHLEILNIAEKKRFMDCEKLIAVISEAASSGISLQADRREKNQRRRVHITLELPWSADKAIQQFGRSHRSNQVSAPEYLFLISELAGEQRFASIVAKRLESLGALTHGDRRATESRDLSRYNFDTKYGRQALDVVLKSVVGHEKPIVPLPKLKNTKSNFLQNVKESLIGIGLIVKDERTGVHTIADKDYTNISRFLNRILGMTVELQNTLFQYFTETLAAIVKDAKRAGRFDEGIVDLGAQGESVMKTDTKTFLCPSISGKVTTDLITVTVERGLSFEKAQQMECHCQDSNEGFYSSIQLRNGKKTAVFILKHNSLKKNWYSIYRPNIGLVAKPEPMQDILKKYQKASALDVESLWNDQYDYSENNCTHAFWRGFCKRKIIGLSCEVGTRKRTCHILCGSVLSVWSKVETLLSVQPGPYSKMQIIRAKLDNGVKVVGLLIPTNCIDPLVRVFTADDSIEKSF